MRLTHTLVPALLLTTTMLAPAVTAIAEETATAHEGKAASQEAALVIFLTQTEPMQAGHALHFATHTLTDGHRATIVLVGEAGRLALADQPTSESTTADGDLQKQLREFIDSGGQVYITPLTLTAIKAQPGDLIAGVGLPDNPAAVHAHMFAPGTKLLAW